ncbi:MAG: hypothetical protein WA705_13780 [Candidatus Ozemobacteraceae bacterium]
MEHPSETSFTRKSNCFFAILASVILVLFLAAYPNHFSNGFHFDDSHTVVDNLFIRDLANIPRFFTDVTTFNSLSSNQSYCLLVSASFAVDYRLGGGLNPLFFRLSTFFWFFFALIPTSVIPFAEVANDHRMFFPYVGLVLAVVWAVHRLWKKTSLATLRACATIFPGQSLAAYREGHFKSSIEAANEALRFDPLLLETWNKLCPAHNSLGQFDKGRFAGEKALELRPDFPLAKNNLAWSRIGIASQARVPLATGFGPQ